jgi:hypothetical protein
MKNQNGTSSTLFALKGKLNQSSLSLVKPEMGVELGIAFNGWKNYCQCSHVIFPTNSYYIAKHGNFQRKTQ